MWFSIARQIFSRSGNTMALHCRIRVFASSQISLQTCWNRSSMVRQSKRNTSSGKSPQEDVVLVAMLWLVVAMELVSISTGGEFKDGSVVDMAIQSWVGGWVGLGVWMEDLLNRVYVWLWWWLLTTGWLKGPSRYEWTMARNTVYIAFRELCGAKITTPLFVHVWNTTLGFVFVLYEVRIARAQCTSSSSSSSNRVRTHSGVYNRELCYIQSGIWRMGFANIIRTPVVN